jgi:DNA-binding CsgD family transcriptional regulator
MHGLDLSSHYFTKTSADLNTILTPVMAPVKLNFFRYLKLYNDGTRVHLCNNNIWTNHFYKQGLYKVAWFDRYVPSHHLPGKAVWDEKALTNDNIVGIHARTVFDINHGFSVVIPSKDFCEFFDFATSEDNLAINDVYMRSPEYIDEIIFYFRFHARNIMSQAEKHKILLPMEAKIIANPVSLDSLNYASINRFYVTTPDGEIYMTRREYDCLSLWFCGKSAKQVAPILGISFRTVERHLENIKDKFNIQYKENLFSQLQSLGLFETLIKNGLRLFREYNL